jgi:hypothetical protein
MTLYEEFETDTSFRYLKEIVKIFEKTVCIIGGWAVYFTVNEHFKKEHGRNYLGSRDIDLVFTLIRISIKRNSKIQILVER